MNGYITKLTLSVVEIICSLLLKRNFNIVLADAKLMLLYKFLRNQLIFDRNVNQPVQLR